MKRFVLLMWDLGKPQNFRVAMDREGETMIFPRRKEARDYAATLPVGNGFAYRTVRVTL